MNLAWRVLSVGFGLLTALAFAGEPTEHEHTFKTHFVFHLPATNPEAVAPADVAEESAKIYYVKQALNADTHALETDKQESFVLDGAAWGGLNETQRYYRVANLFFADAKPHGERFTRFACFTGSPEKLLEQFFKDEYAVRNVLEDIQVTVSSDHKMISFETQVHARVAKLNASGKGFEVKAVDAPIYFRLSACASVGKGDVLADLAASLSQAVDLSVKKTSEVKTSERAEAPVAGNEENESLEEGFEALSTRAIADEPGYNVNDKLTATEQREANRKGLPTFQLVSDYEKATPEEAKKEFNARPWRGLDVRDPTEGAQLSLKVLNYIFEGMADQDAENPDQNFRAEQSANRYWCHMPWLSIGEAQREAIHGLTKERNLFSSPIYEFNSSDPQGTDWGVAFYNAPGCKTLHSIYGGTDEPEKRQNPEWGNANFLDGTLTYKILFTTGDFETITDAFPWNAHVGKLGEDTRKIRPMKMIQIDVAIRDKTLKGVMKDNNDWVMLTYYYDAHFLENPEDLATFGYRKKSDHLKGLNIHSALKHMRPMGIQWGFEAQDSQIFAGSLTNQIGAKEQGFKSGRLNGPADNPKSSCLSCHGTAGTRVAMSPGFMSNADYLKNKSGSLDFSQQVSLAMRNWETRKKPAKKTK